MTATPIPEGLTDAGDGTFYGTALAALRARYEVQGSELDPWRLIDDEYDVPAGRYLRCRPPQQPDPEGTWLPTPTSDQIATTVGAMRDRVDLDQWEFACTWASGWASYDTSDAPDYDAPDDLPVIVRRKAAR